MINFSVIMPTYKQAGFIIRAVKSLLAQTHQDWELIIINDGSDDNTKEKIDPFLSDKRIRYIYNSTNTGLGYALNQGLDLAKYEYIAYLPSDDFYFENHLEVLANEFEHNKELILCYTKVVTNNFNATYTNFIPDTYPLQLVQTAHVKTADRWMERNEMVTSDLYEMFWNKLVSKGIFLSVNKETSYWTHHPSQRHKLINEDYGGGLNIYRQYYQPVGPLNVRVSKYKTIDENDLYKDFQSGKVKVNSQNKGLKILIIGELAYNSERIVALEEYGHKLYGLWQNYKILHSFNTVGPIPFGNVVNIPYKNYKEKIAEIKPDIIYGCLNIGIEDFVIQITDEFPNIPFVWHYKEGPLMSLNFNNWEKLIKIYDKADGNIYINPECKQWCELFISSRKPSMILDGDLPKKEYFMGNFSEKLSASDGEIHTVVPGRIMGVKLEDIKTLADNKVHVHLYTENYHSGRQGFNHDAKKLAPDYFHVHSHCPANKWVEEFSKYDAGWLHCFDSHNNGNIMSATWDDLNMPARMNTLAAAGLPMIVKKNEGHIVGMRSHLQHFGAGVYFDSFIDLSEKLYDKDNMDVSRQNVLNNRKYFIFDHYVPELTDFFNLVIDSKKNGHDRS